MLLQAVATTFRRGCWSYRRLCKLTPQEPRKTDCLHAIAIRAPILDQYPGKLLVRPRSSAKGCAFKDNLGLVITARLHRLHQRKENHMSSLQIHHY